MIEFLFANMAEIIMTVLATVLAGVWGVLVSVKNKFFKDMSERKTMWELELQKIHQDFDELKHDHEDIKRDLSTIKKELTEKVEKIMVDHASHERDQAVQLEILRDLKEMNRNAK